MENAVSVKAEGGAGRDALIFCLPFCLSGSESLLPLQTMKS